MLSTLETAKHLERVLSTLESAKHLERVLSTLGSANAGVTCQNRKWLHMSRLDFTCLLTRFLLLQELGEAYSLRDNKLL